MKHITPATWKHHLTLWSGMLLTVSMPLLAASTANGVGPSEKRSVHFREVSGDVGIHFRRVKSPRDAIYDQIKARGILKMSDLALVPMHSRGVPGVAILDFDGDGDDDIFVTNGPDVAHSLYKNKLKETGRLEFEDVAVAAGVAAVEQDGTGVCFGDTDNDGDEDLVVLGVNGNRFFENNKDGTFRDATNVAGFGGTKFQSVGCSMGDVNGDGLLDVLIGNTYTDWTHQKAMFVEPFALNEHNQLFINLDHNKFEDRGAAAGIKNFAAITWATAMVDYDMDGDIDIITANDQGPIPPTEFGGVDRGYLRVYQNDGTGVYADVTQQVHTDRWGFWMGLAFGDLNNDGHMDMFATNVGGYTIGLMPVPHSPGNGNSSWFLGGADGKFTDPGVGALKRTPFGWGASIMDYDNDGDSDIVYYGGFDLGLMVESSNPGVILKNDGVGNFERDTVALARSIDHSRRVVHGVAVGDLNDDGFTDIVSAAAMEAPTSLPQLPNPHKVGGPFDDAKFIPTYTPTSNGEFMWNGFQFTDGTLAVEVSDRGNRNNWAKVRLVGSAGLTHKGKANRDGIGAVVTFALKHNRTAMRPVLGGASHASQDSLTMTFGMGREKKATIDVLWPGGVRNRLYDVHASERIKFPEIPCSYTTDESFRSYRSCVKRALNELEGKKVVTAKERARFLESALRAYDKDDRITSSRGDAALAAYR